MTATTGTFSAVNQASSVLSLAAGQSVEVILANTGGHTWRVDLEEMTKGDSGTRFVASYSSDTTSTIVTNTTGKLQRLRLRAMTISGGDSIAYTLQDSVPVTQTNVQQRVISGAAKAGATSGWAVDGATNVGKMATLPKNKTASTLVIRIPRLAVGDRIVGAYLVGSLQGAASKHTTILLDIRRLTAAAAGASDARIGVMSAALDVVANTVVGKSNTQVRGIDYTVAEGESYYALVTATTADDDACTAEVQALVLQIIPA